MKNKKLLRAVISFIALIPFRLPLTVLLLLMLNFITGLTKVELSDSVIVSNVVVTKIIYNLIFSVIFFNNVIPLLVNYFKINTGKDYDDKYVLLSGFLIVSLSSYCVFDAAITYQICETILEASP